MYYMEKETMKFELVKEKHRPNTHKCPGCWRGRLAYKTKEKLWVCCKEGGGFMWCGRKYRGKKQ